MPIDPRTGLKQAEHMLVRLLLQLQRLALLVALSVSLTATAYAHRAPLPDDAALAFILAHGGEICGQDGHDGPMPGMECPACHLVSALDLPPVAAVPARLLLPLPAPRHVAPVQPAPARVLDPAHGPQGPPLA